LPSAGFSHNCKMVKRTGNLCYCHSQYVPAAFPDTRKLLSQFHSIFIFFNLKKKLKQSRLRVTCITRGKKIQPWPKRKGKPTRASRGRIRQFHSIFIFYFFWHTRKQFYFPTEKKIQSHDTKNGMGQKKIKPPQPSTSTPIVQLNQYP
jgi:hypothetical protein